MAETVHDAVSAAWDSAGSDATEAPTAGETSTTPVTPEETTGGVLDETNGTPLGAPLKDKAEAGRDEKGRFAKANGRAPAAKKEAATEATTATEAAPVVAETTTQAPAEPKWKAPQSWKPLAREAWAKLPPEVQEEVARREAEVPRAMEEAANAKQFQRQVNEALRPYEMLARSAGQHPVEYAASLMQTAAVLQTGAPQQRAAVVANIIKNFGVDVNALAAALDGQPGAAQPQPPMQDPRVDQLLQRIEQAERQRAQGSRERAVSEAAKFGQGKEFFADVRETMADIIEVQARRGVEMSLEDAYARAVQMDPELSKVMAQREAAKARTTAVAATQRARVAASSVRSSPAAAASAAQSRDVRSIVAQAWDDAERG